MFRKIIWALLEVATIGCGTYVFVSTMVNEDFVDHEVAGIGATLIVAGLLLRNWRMTLFVREEKGESSKGAKQETPNKVINTLLVVILSISVFALYRKTNNLTLDVDSNESQIQSLESQISDFDELEDRVEAVEYLEERIDDLENYSHTHY